MSPKPHWIKPSRESYGSSLCWGYLTIRSLTKISTPPCAAVRLMPILRSNLPGRQEKLLEAVAGTGKPVVLVLQNGRPLSITWAAQHVPAILEAWYPGELGGRAIAETLFGDNNPAGRLPITFPRSVGQIPDFYNHFPSRKDSYIEGDSSPLFVFGHGLSYTTFKYDDLKIVMPSPRSTADVLVSCKISNTS